MKAEGVDKVRYDIFDPTGNITALVVSPVEEAGQPAVADALMARHAAVEQVGFVRFSPDGAASAALRMAGGEFCANASMSAAALCALRLGLDRGTVTLSVSGAEEPVEVELEKETDGGFRAAVRMPRAREITELPYACGGVRGTLPLVRLDGITHAVIMAGSPFYFLKDAPAAAEEAVCALCASLGAACLGLMFLEGEGAARHLTPLVYVPGSGTLFWESSCASGSAAAGMLLARRSGRRTELELIEPGGILRVESDPTKGETWLFGRTKLRGEYGV